MIEPRRIVVHDLAQAEAALAAACACDRSVVLESAPGAGAAMGAPWFRHMILRAAVAQPGARFTVLLDCGTAAGYALAALRDGAGRIRLAAPPELLARVRAVADDLGASVEDGAEPRPPALDLLGRSDPFTAAREWLAGSIKRGECGR